MVICFFYMAVWVVQVVSRMFQMVSMVFVVSHCVLGGCQGVVYMVLQVVAKTFCIDVLGGIKVVGVLDGCQGVVGGCQIVLERNSMVFRMVDRGSLWLLW